MDARLTWAVRNNANWCDLVCRSHRIPTRFRPELWATAQPPPRFYPDAVTLQAHVAAEDVLAAISPHPGASVKDSFATLDLGRHGFDELFEAELLRHPHVRFLAAHDQRVDIPAAVHAAFSNAALVGYERGPSLLAAIAAGFRDLGPLRVWLQPPAV